MNKNTLKYRAVFAFSSTIIACSAILVLLSSSPTIAQETRDDSGAPTETADLTDRTQEEVLEFCEDVSHELHYGSAAVGTENGVPPYRVPIAGSLFEFPDARYNNFPLTSWIDTIYPPFGAVGAYNIDDYNGVNSYAVDETEPPENREQLNLVQGARVRPTFGYGPANFRYRHKDTELIKPVHLNPWYLTSLQGIEVEQPPSPYLGTVYRGSRNFHRHRNRLTNVVSSAPRGANGIARNAADGCVRVIEPDRSPIAIRPPIVPHDAAQGFRPPNYLDPVWNRMEVDNCANQFILSRARQVRTIFQPQGENAFVNAEQQRQTGFGLYSRGLADGSGRAEILAQKFCQTFRLVPLPHEEQEYFPSDYLMFSWRKLLFDPRWLLRDGMAAKEPHYYANGVDIPADQAIPEPFVGVEYQITAENPTPVSTRFQNTAPVTPTPRASPFTFGGIRGIAAWFRSFLDAIGRSYRPETDFTFNYDAVEETSEFENGAICVNDVTERQYERILDPSHPFTPRWDFSINDRDYYSPMTIAYGGNRYDQVRCAGAPNSMGGVYAAGTITPEPEGGDPEEGFGGGTNDARAGGSAQSYVNGSENYPDSEHEEGSLTEDEAKTEAEEYLEELREDQEALREDAFISNLTSEFIPKVDILTWRQTAFDEVITQRIMFNIICYYTEVNGASCWEEFECGDNTVGNQATGQCCATNWDGEDAPAIAENYLTESACGEVSIRDACEAIARPLAPMNPLKLVPAERENIPEGYHFSSYFGVHRPYMRCWDMGKECGNEDPLGLLTNVELGENLAGSTYAVAGVGRNRAGEGPRGTGEMCRIGGGDNRQSILNPGVRFGAAPGEEGANIPDPTAEPITSWAELKLYQARGVRDFALNCFVKHETLFKQGAGEEIILSRSGGEFQTIALDSTGERTQVESEAWPMSWRGYISDSDENYRFPHYASVSGRATMKGTGLDASLPGDIAVFNRDIVMTGSEQNRRMPYIGYITESHTEAQGKPGLEWVRALAFNNGRFLDACGNTDFWGQGEEYTMWKTDVPELTKIELRTLGFPPEMFASPPTEGLGFYDDQVNTVIQGTGGAYAPPTRPTCDDPGMSNCIENYWGEVETYFAPNDLRH